MSEYRIGWDRALGLVGPGKVQNLAVEEDSRWCHDAAAKRLIYRANKQTNNVDHSCFLKNCHVHVGTVTEKNNDSTDNGDSSYRASFMYIIYLFPHFIIPHNRNDEVIGPHDHDLADPCAVL